MTVKVQCGHNGKSLELSQHRGCRVTGDWTVGHLVEVLEQLTAVHRECQRLMFSGKSMSSERTIKSMFDSKSGQLPDRISLFMLVDRDEFPECLGPFNPVKVPVEPSDFGLPDLSDASRQFGFYWEMKEEVLERHGLSVGKSSSDASGAATGDFRKAVIIGQCSPSHPVTHSTEEREAVGIPPEAEEFVWSYPTANWKDVEADPYVLDNWEEQPNRGGAELQSFLSIGGFIYLDHQQAIVAVITYGRPPAGAKGCLQFGPPQKWQPDWTEALVEQGRWHNTTMRSLQALGAQRFCWLRPEEIVHPGDGVPLATQPQVPHGGFVYLFHEDCLVAEPSELNLDRYFPMMPVAKVPFGHDALFRPYTFVDGESSNVDEPLESFLMSVPEEVE